MSQLTITEQAIEQKIFAKLDKNDRSIITRVYVAGMKVLFSPATHQKMVSEFESQLKSGHDVGSVIGMDIAHIMVVLFNESKGTMPKGAIIPAGTMLIAKACEFMNEDKIASVTDADFGAAVHMMSTVVMSKFDKGFASKMGGQNAQPNAQQGQQPPVNAQPNAQPPGGMLTQGGAPNA
jgi:hypothetical protein